MKKINSILVVLVVISVIILGILFFQDKTKKLEDRSYKEIEKIIVGVDSANINIYKSLDNNVRVVIYGTKKDNTEIIEGSKELTVHYTSKDTVCFLKCNKSVDIYVPDKFPELRITTTTGDIYSSDVTVNNMNAFSQDGNITIDKVQNVDVDTTYGDVSIKEINANDDSYIKTNTGDINISKIINLNLNIITEFGHKVVPVIRNEQDYTLKIETNVGIINIDSHEDKS